MIKKILFTIMTISLLSTSVYAAETTQSATLSVENTECSVGETVTVDINISDATYAGYQMDIYYDEKTLEPIEVLPGADHTSPISNLEAEGTDGPCIRVAYASLDEGSGTGDALFSINFKVKDSATSDTADIALEEVLMFNVDGQDIPVTVENGAVTISGNQDTIDTKDDFPISAMIGIPIAVVAIAAVVIIMVKKRK